MSGFKSNNTQPFQNLHSSSNLAEKGKFNPTDLPAEILPWPTVKIKAKGTDNSLLTNRM